MTVDGKFSSKYKVLYPSAKVPSALSTMYTDMHIMVLLHITFANKFTLKREKLIEQEQSRRLSK